MKANIHFKIKVKEKNYYIHITDITFDNELYGPFFKILKIKYQNEETKEEFFYYDKKWTSKFYEKHEEKIKSAYSFCNLTDKYLEMLLIKETQNLSFNQEAIENFKNHYRNYYEIN